MLIPDALALDILDVLCEANTELQNLTDISNPLAYQIRKLIQKIHESWASKKEGKEVAI